MSSSVAGGPAAAPLRPTAAMVRAGSAAVILLALALIAGRVELVLIALPFLAWSVLALAGRMRRESRDPAPAVRMRSSAREILEGGSAVVEVRAPAGHLVATSWPLRAHTVFSPGRGSVVDTEAARLAVTVRRWGRYDIGPAHAVVADPLGAHRAAHTLPAAVLEVTPSSSVLDAPLEVPRPIGMSGAHLSRRRGDGTALADVRPFRAGDRLARINWRVTSRTGHLHTNATFTEQDTDVVIVTDTTSDVVPSKAAGPAAETSLDMTVRATAAIARHYLAAGDRVCVHDLGGLVGHVRPGTGPRQLRTVTTALARAHRPSGEAARVRRLRGVRGGTLAVVCSPLLSAAVIEQIGDLVANGADVVVVDTFPAGAGDTSILRGAPTRRRHGVVDDRFWDEAWALRRLARRATLRDLRARGVPVTAWEGPASLTPVLLSLSVAASAPRAGRL